MPDGGPAVPPLLVIQPPAGENGPVGAGHLPYRRHTLAGRGPGRKFLNRRLLQASTGWAAGVRRLELQSQRSACSITDASGHQPRPRDRAYPGKVACRVGAHGVGAADEVRDRSLPPQDTVVLRFVHLARDLALEFTLGHDRSGRSQTESREEKEEKLAKQLAHGKQSAHSRFERR